MGGELSCKKCQIGICQFATQALKKVWYTKIWRFGWRCSFLKSRLLKESIWFWFDLEFNAHLATWFFSGFLSSEKSSRIWNDFFSWINSCEGKSDRLICMMWYFGFFLFFIFWLFMPKIYKPNRSLSLI